MILSKISVLIGACSLSCFALLAMPAQAQMSTEHQLGVLGTGDSELDTGSYFDTYEIEGFEGQRVALSLDSSDFNAFLGLFDSDGNTVLINDNAAEENPNSYISVMLPHTGTYTVIATSQTAQEGGDYRLALRSFAPPPSPTASTAASSVGGVSGFDMFMSLMSVPFIRGMAIDAVTSAFSSSGSSSNNRHGCVNGVLRLNGTYHSC